MQITIDTKENIDNKVVKICNFYLSRIPVSLSDAVI